MIDKDRVDETAMAFSCSLLSAACICDTIRSHDREAGDYPTRVYIQRNPPDGPWTKLNSMTVLVVTDVTGADGHGKGVLALSPNVFSSPKEKVPLAPAVPLQTGILTW